MNQQSYENVERYLESLNQQDKETSLFEASFIEHAQDYATKLHLKLPYLTFREMGVSEAVLRSAGIKDTSYSHLRSEFIRSSKQYADIHGIEFEQLEKAGVPAHVLLEAGYKPKQTRGSSAFAD